MGANPDPEKTIRHIHCDGAIPRLCYSHCINVANFFEMQLRSAGIFFPQMIGPAGRLSDWFGQFAVELPEFICPRRFHPSTGLSRWHVLAELWQSACRAARPSHLLRIAYPKAHRDNREVHLRAAKLLALATSDGFANLTNRTHVQCLYLAQAFYKAQIRSACPRV